MWDRDNIDFLLFKLVEAQEKLTVIKNEVLELRSAIHRHTLRNKNTLTSRDQYIYVQHILGDSFESLAAEYKLSPLTIRDICSREKLKLKRASG
jgi:hypothetical protein